MLLPITDVIMKYIINFIKIYYFAVESIIIKNNKFIHLSDIDENTDLFYGTSNKNSIEKMMMASFELYHFNKYYENILF